MRATIPVVVLAACAPRVVVGSHTAAGQTAEYALYAPAGEGSYQIAVLLPGDGFPATDLPRERRVRRWADEAHAIVVSVDPPSPPATGCWWTPRKHTRAAFLVDLLEAEVFAIYDVDREAVDLGGWSGGAFLAFGIPFYADLPFSGGLVGACGADIPRTETDDDYCGDDLSDDPTLEVDPTTAAALANGRRVYVARTTGDELVDVIDAGVAFWQDLGATTRLVDEGPGGHCDFDVTGALIDGLRWVGEGR